MVWTWRVHALIPPMRTSLLRRRDLRNLPQIVYADGAEGAARRGWGYGLFEGEEAVLHVMG